MNNSHALTFLSSLPSACPPPDMWMANGEITLEWQMPGKHAFVCFEEDGSMGYSMKFSDGFRAGSGDASAGAPDDLIAYLCGEQK